MTWEWNCGVEAENKLMRCCLFVSTWCFIWFYLPSNNLLVEYIWVIEV